MVVFNLEVSFWEKVMDDNEIELQNGRLLMEYRIEVNILISWWSSSFLVVLVVQQDVALLWEREYSSMHIVFI